MKNAQFIKIGKIKNMGLFRLFSKKQVPEKSNNVTYPISNDMSVSVEMALDCYFALKKKYPADVSTLHVFSSAVEYGVYSMTFHFLLDGEPEWFMSQELENVIKLYTYEDGGGSWKKFLYSCEKTNKGMDFVKHEILHQLDLYCKRHPDMTYTNKSNVSVEVKQK